MLTTSQIQALDATVAELPSDQKFFKINKIMETAGIPFSRFSSFAPQVARWLRSIGWKSCRSAHEGKMARYWFPEREDAGIWD